MTTTQKEFRSYTVTGMDCADCALHVEKAVKKVPGVTDIKINLISGQIDVYTPSESLDEELIRKAVRDAGYDILTSHFTKTIFTVEPLNSVDAERLAQCLDQIIDVREYHINPLTNEITVTHTNSPQRIANYLGQHHFPIQIKKEQKSESEPGTQRLFFTSLISGILLVLGNISAYVIKLPFLSLTFFAFTILIGGFPIAVKGFKEARHLRLGMNFLMSLAIFGAVALGEWSEAAMVVFLFVLAQYLESRTMNRARRSIDMLMDHRPNTAQIKKDGTFETVFVEEVGVGQIIGVKPGENIPIDGTVIAGTSSIDQSSITGESIPVDVKESDAVYAGTLNRSGFLEIRVEREYSNSTYAKILDLVARAQSQKSPHQTFVEKFSIYYTPAIIITALLIAILPPLIWDLLWSKWIYRALVLLVIACPCAFVISTPVTVISGLTNAMRKGILVKGGKFLELFAQLQAIAFDKTGTLTEGKLRIQKIIPVNKTDTLTIVDIAATLAAKSGHPVSEAISEYAKNEGATLQHVEQFRAIEGMGVEGKIDGTLYLLGNHRFFESRGWCDQHIHEKLDQIEDSNHTAVLVGTESGIIGIIAIADNLRHVARQTIRSLKNNGIKHVHLLTGDNRKTAQAIARDSEVDEFDAELLPQDKVSVIDRLKTKFHIVAMVGDGVNDAPALAQASVGVAMGVRGSDTALETADIALMSDDLSRLVFLKKLSSRTIRIIKQNIFIALSLKFIFLFLAIPGLATLWMAVFADMGASLIVILNGLRVLAIRPETSS